MAGRQPGRRKGRQLLAHRTGTGAGPVEEAGEVGAAQEDGGPQGERLVVMVLIRGPGKLKCIADLSPPHSSAQAAISAMLASFEASPDREPH